MHRFRRYAIFWTAFFLLLLCDQLTKLATLEWIPRSYENPPIEVIPGLFNLVHVYNQGAAFSILSGQRWPLVLLAIAAIIGIFFWRRAVELERSVVQAAFGLLTGGIVGNVFDRLAYGHVIDFLDFNLPFYGKIVHALFGWPANSHWPAFNIADCGITCGVGIYLVYSLFRKTPEAVGNAG